MPTPKVLVFAGSTREKSLNKLLAKAAMEGARSAGAEVTWFDLREHPMPLYDEDLEKQGMPEAVRRFREALKAHQAVIVTTPEYNGGISGVLKNAIDWASRPEPGRPGLECFVGKVALAMSASQGQLGGIRALHQLRSVLLHVQMILVPDQMALSNAGAAFDQSGRLADEKTRATVERLGAKLADLTRRLHT